MNKLKKLKALGSKRKRSHWPDYEGIADRYRRYECDFVSPYTRTAKNFDSPILVLLQDWSSVDAMLRGFDENCADKGYYPNLPTNRRLIELLQITFKVALGDIFATNLFPFIKKGGISAIIPQRDLVRAATEYAIPQIKIVRPKLVICLGLATFNALRIAIGGQPVYPMASAIRSPFDLGNSRIWCQAHTGARGQSNRGRKQVVFDWRRMKKEVPIKAATGGD